MNRLKKIARKRYASKQILADISPKLPKRRSEQIEQSEQLNAILRGYQAGMAFYVSRNAYERAKRNARKV